MAGEQRFKFKRRSTFAQDLIQGINAFTAGLGVAKGIQDIRKGRTEAELGNLKMQRIKDLLSGMKKRERTDPGVDPGFRSRLQEERQMSITPEAILEEFPEAVSVAQPGASLREDMINKILLGIDSAKIRSERAQAEKFKSTAEKTRTETRGLEQEIDVFDERFASEMSESQAEIQNRLAQATERTTGAAKNVQETLNLAKKGPKEIEKINAEIANFKARSKKLGAETESEKIKPLTRILEASIKNNLLDATSAMKIIRNATINMASNPNAEPFDVFQGALDGLETQEEKDEAIRAFSADPSILSSGFLPLKEGDDKETRAFKVDHAIQLLWGIYRIPLIRTVADQGAILDKEGNPIGMERLEVQAKGEFIRTVLPAFGLKRDEDGKIIGFVSQFPTKEGMGFIEGQKAAIAQLMATISSAFSTSEKQPGPSRRVGAAKGGGPALTIDELVGATGPGPASRVGASEGRRR